MPGEFEKKRKKSARGAADQIGRSDLALRPRGFYQGGHVNGGDIPAAVRDAAKATAVKTANRANVFPLSFGMGSYVPIGQF